jgi:DME family drug/metabolite transporter
VSRRGGAHTGAVLLATLLWGTTGTVAHYAPRGSTQALVGLATFGFGGVLLFAIDARATVRLIRDRSALPLLLTGAVGVAMYAACYYASMALVGVAVGNALALGSGPIFAAALELLVERTRVRRGWAIALAVSVAGIACLGASADSSSGPNPVAGVMLALTAGFGYALYSWAGARLIRRGHDSRPVMAGVFSLAALGLLPAFFIIGPGPLYSARGTLVLAYLAIIPMALAYLLFGYGLRRMAASAATALALAEPVVATLLAILVLREHLEAVAWIGLALIVLGIVVLAITERETN